MDFKGSDLPLMKNYQQILNFNGFVLLPEIFESSSIDRAKNGLWEVIKRN